MSRSTPNPMSTAVMARRSAAEVETDTAQQALWRTLDLFATPPWAARACADKLREVFPTARNVIEPAAGLGQFAGPLAEYFDVASFDVHDHGVGANVVDWLDPTAWSGAICDLVATNPPFKIADQFVTLGLQRARQGVALLLRTAFLEGGERHAILAGAKASSLTLFVQFSERVPMVLGGWDPRASSATSYALFVWAKDRDPMPPQWFGPGTRERFWKDDDERRYGRREPMPLFDGPAP